MYTIEDLRNKFRKDIYIPLTCKARGNGLREKNFTIISNNCWGGTVYAAHNLPKESPTVGMFFMAEDYIRFLSDLRVYIASDLRFITPEESKWVNAPQVSGDKRFGTYPVGKLKDIELFFLHYHSELEAMDKWQRRINRINWDRLLVKFNDQNGCTEKEVKEFANLPYKNKLFFTCKDWSDSIIYKEKLGKSYCRIKNFTKQEYVYASQEPYGASPLINITNYINNL